MSTQMASAGGGRSLPHNYEVLRDIVQSEHGRHWTAHDVYVEGRKRLPTIGFATVHRGLIRLCELGAIMKIETPGKEAAWYEAAAPPHAHLHCVTCHGVADVAFHTSARTRAAIAAESGFSISDEIVTFQGRCARCTALATP